MARWLDRVRQMRAEPRIKIPDRYDEVGVPEHELPWRVAVFRTQIPPRGPIGYLHATPRTVDHDTLGHCGSCDEPMEDGQRFCCRACAKAKWQALNEQREDIPVEVN